MSPMPLSFRAAVTTDVGTVRTNNEDAALTSPHLIAIADGMGGHAAGEVASGIAIDQLARLLDEHNSGQTELSTESIRNRLIQARSILRAMSIADPELAGMGTTVVGLAITQKAWCWPTLETPGSTDFATGSSFNSPSTIRTCNTWSRWVGCARRMCTTTLSGR